MSEMKFKKAKLVKVLDGHRLPVDIHLWLESEWSVYYDCVDDTQEFAYKVLKAFLEDQDMSCDYYLFDDELYKVESTEEKDAYGFVEAKQEYDDIEVSALYHNGGGSMSECITEALKKLENEL